MKKERKILFDDYSIEMCTDNEEFNKFFDENIKFVFPDSAVYNASEVFDDNEKDSINNLKENMGELYRLTLYILKGDEKIGWFNGRQTDSETFKMTNTGIFIEHRNKGIYKKMLPEILEIVKEKGFQKVFSQHNAANNNVIVPKLKAGFVITGFEISDVFGILIHLTYYFNKTRRKVHNFRTGSTANDKEVRKVLSIK